MGTFLDPEMQKWVIEEDKRLRKAAKEGDKQAQEELKKLPKTSGIAKALSDPKVYASAKTGKGPTYLEQKYYETVYGPRQQQMIEQAVAANPNLQVKENRDKNGKLISREVINPDLPPPKNKYLFPDPSNPKNQSKHANQRSAAISGIVAMNQLVNNKPYDRKEIDKTRNKLNRPDTGGNNFFGSIGKAFESAMPKITMPKVVSDIGKGLEKTVSTATQGVGKFASETTKTLGKGAEGLVANTADVAGALAKGDFKDLGKEALELVQTGKDIGKGLASANVGVVGSAVGTVGAGLGDKNIKEAATNIEREGRKGVSEYGDAAMDIGANIATGGGYGAAKTALSGLSKGGLGALVSSEGLQDLAVQGIASQTGYDPNLLKMGLSAAQGDVKGTALSGLGSYAGIDPNQLKMGLSAVTGDKEGLISGLASQLGADESVSNLAGDLAGGNMDLKKIALEQFGSLAGLTPEQLKMANTGVSALTGDKSGLASGLASQFGAGEDMSNMLGSLAGGGDLKSTALQKLGSMSGLDPKMLDSISKGKIDPMQLAGVAGFDPKQLLGGAASSLGLSAIAGSPEAQEMIKMGQSAGRVVASADAYVDDAQNRALDAQKSAQSAYKIAKGDSFNAIAKKLGVTPEQLKAANPQIKDINKIAAGANLNIPSSVKTPYETPEQTAARKAATDAGAIANTETEPSMWDKIKTGVSSAFGGAKNFVAENKDTLGLAAQAAAAGLGYQAQSGAADTQENLLKQQLQQEQALGRGLMEKKLDPKRYAQEQKFLTERIQGQGRTALTRQMEQESIQKGARTAAAGRLAGLEQQARLGGAALGTAGLASSLAGAQAGQNVMAEDMRARDVQAEQNLERAIQRTGALSTQAVQEEADLANKQFDVERQRAMAAGATRSQLSQIEQNRADALSRLYTTGADLVKQGLQGMKTSTPQQQVQQQQPQQQTPPPARVDAARTLSQGTPQSQQPKPAPKPNPVQEMNQRNTMPQPGAGQGYGVLAPVQQAQQKVQQTVQQGQQAVQKVQNTFDEAKKKAEELKNNPLGAFGIKI